LLAGKTLVLLSAVPWNGLYARPQQFSTRLAAMGVRVLFVEPAASMLSPLKERSIPTRSSVREIAPNLIVFTPPLLLPFSYALRLVNLVNQAWLWRSICRAAKQVGWSIDYIFTHVPGTADLPAHQPIIYDCVDDHAAFSTTSYLWRRELVLELEQKLLQRAWRVFASAEALLKNCLKLRPDTLLIGNGADIKHFAPAGQKASGIVDMHHPIVGFYGGIGPWINLDMIAEAAKLRLDISFIMLGPVDSAVKLPAPLPNLRFTGLMPYAKLPDYLADFDVALVPFKNTELTQSVNPLKLYEYFAAGKPVIVPDIPELTRWHPLVYVANNSAELLQQIASALNEDPVLADKRRKAAQDNSWEAKLAALLEGLKT